MEEFFQWIDKNLNNIKGKPIYDVYFNGILLDEDYEDVSYLTNYEKGISLVVSKSNVITSIHLFGNDGPEQKRFKDELPLNVSFSFSRQNVLTLFGRPNKSGGGHTSVLIGFMNTWDKYNFPSYSLRFEYSKDESEIVLITFASLTLEAAFNSAFQ